MKVPYKANMRDMVDPSDESDLDCDHYSNDEIDESEDQENEDDEEIQESDTRDDSHLVSVKKKRKVINESTNTIMPKKRKKLEHDLYKPPTVEELNQLRETENLFHSNLFRLQIEEMLNEIKIKDRYKNLFDAWFQKFVDTVKSIKDSEQYRFADKKLEKQLGMHIPMPKIRQNKEDTFKFLKPSNITVIGSYAFNGIVGPNITVDIMIEMPAKIFHKQDCLNYRYMKKKAMYLAYVASHITDDIADDKKYVGNNLRPMLKIIPNGKLGKKLNVLVHISAQEESFALRRLLPEKNNVKPGWFFTDTTNEDASPTPHYNSIILHDLTMSRMNLENMKMLKEYPNLRDGIILLKIWLAQRELTKRFVDFNGHVITMFVLYLLSIKKLNTFMSSYQVVRNVWTNLVQVSWCETGITMNQNEDTEKTILNYKKYYDCVFLDPTGYHNIAAYISKSTFCWVQQEAKYCLNHLDSVHADSFQSLFMRKVPFYRAFDHLICFKDTQQLKNIVNATSTSIDRLDYGLNYRDQIIKILHNLLTKGLTNRVQQICVLPKEVIEWECTQNIDDDIGEIVIGLELNPEFCFTIVDKGPEANLPEAVTFREFWGDKSELRRFQDGSVRETVVWSKGKTISGKRMICKNIVTFLLLKKIGLSKDQFTYIADEMEEVLKLSKIKITHFTYGTGEEASLKVINAFNSFEKELMSLTDIPLSIHGVQGSNAVFRYADVFPPLATVYRSDKKLIKNSKNCLILSKNITQAPRYVCPLEVSLQLSTSGKWPDELEAFRNTKAAFHIQIAECLRQQCMLKANANFSYIDVYKEGFVFRLRIAHQKEIGCLKQQVTEDGVTQYKDNDESIELENKLFELPKLTSALHGLHVQQPSFGAACCLTKRWLSAQLLDNSHIPDVVVELLIASMYLTPAPYRPPQMPQVAFLRILEMFARGHWNTDPIIVNFNNEMSREEIVAVETLFGSSRNSLPPLFISTPYDHERSLWTKKAPTTLILNRITALAKQSLKLFEEQLLTKVISDVKALFRPPLTEYDCLIHLKPHMVPRKLQAIDVNEKYQVIDWHPYKKHSHEKIPVVGFDPVQCFLKELRDGYDEFALFFHDTYGGMIIGVLLKPTALEVKEFKVSNINCRKYNSDGQLVLNVSAMIQDFYILGDGIVEAIDVRSKRFSLS
ncbi:nucleolar protein 6 [Hylaeus volcanicus]|uniref:nucleolar protein 6 n=1 Tax=Hylaeus volcanicus TaxID=313075 RepID=UPI0023B7E975|nr:nucleolar protein 6 [Hylaeus volcanicus]